MYACVQPFQAHTYAIMQELVAQKSEATTIIFQPCKRGCLMGEACGEPIGLAKLGGQIRVPSAKKSSGSVTVLPQIPRKDLTMYINVCAFYHNFNMQNEFYLTLDYLELFFKQFFPVLLFTKFEFIATHTRKNNTNEVKTVQISNWNKTEID